ncbi:hypothetical protein [Sulfitobacter guttiformis]|uniref:Phospholipase D-like protein n=1 Tax=Sulfitobacter guttiformis TaxID=74349 RepID=A0A420DQ43_9RHOB|nr:hypothetical protein [Sulfitobacter guttiformis]KIN73600.1 hypothetical protein Z949_2792 [Sulfitobacter guttiformis KCTC 32187]RKE96247.1 hypothetical protein C8N30_0804 [Sulfitobacter guttiformis]
MLEIIAGLLIFALGVFVFIVLPMKMAKARDRSAVGWVLISLLLSPLVAIIGLLVLGRALPAQKI